MEQAASGSCEVEVRMQQGESPLIRRERSLGRTLYHIQRLGLVPSLAVCQGMTAACLGFCNAVGRQGDKSILFLSKTHFVVDLWTKIVCHLIRSCKEWSVNVLIGREIERKRLSDLLETDKSEFVAVYGRRRIGKTFLIRESYPIVLCWGHRKWPKPNVCRGLRGNGPSSKR